MMSQPAQALKQPLLIVMLRLVSVDSLASFEDQFSVNGALEGYKTSGEGGVYTIRGHAVRQPHHISSRLSSSF